MIYNKTLSLCMYQDENVGDCRDDDGGAKRSSSHHNNNYPSTAL
jgi:hypothetical protein